MALIEINGAFSLHIEGGEVAVQKGSQALSTNDTKYVKLVDPNIHEVLGPDPKPASAFQSVLARTTAIVGVLSGAVGLGQQIKDLSS